MLSSFSLHFTPSERSRLLLGGSLCLVTSLPTAGRMRSAPQTPIHKETFLRSDLEATDRHHPHPSPVPSGLRRCLLAGPPWGCLAWVLSLLARSWPFYHQIKTESESLQFLILLFERGLHSQCLFIHWSWFLNIKITTLIKKSLEEK